MRILSLAAMAVLCLSTAASAAPLVPAHVPADAKWVSHINLDAVRGMEMVSKWREAYTKREGYQQKVDWMAENIGMNPMEDLLGVTIYDTEYARHNGVVLMHLTAGHRKKIEAAFDKHKKEHTSSKHAGRTLTTWTERAGRHGEHEVTGCFANDKTIVLGRDPERVKAALDVIDGKQDSLAKDSPLLAGFPKKAIVATNVMDVDAEYQKVTRCPVLKNSQAASFSITQKGDKTRMSCRLETKSDEQAQGYADVVQGLRAMAQLRQGDDEASARVMNGLKVKAKGSTFNVTWQASNEDIHAAVKSGMARRAKMRERWTKMKEHAAKKHSEDKPAGKKPADKKAS